MVAFAENVRRQLLRSSVVVGEEIAFVPACVARENIGHRLHIRAGEVPGEVVSRRADAELAFGQVDRLDSGFEREAERTEAVPGIDAVAIEFAGAAGRNDDRLAQKDRQAVRIFGGSALWRHRQHADRASLSARGDEETDGRCVVEYRDVEADRLPRQNLNHQPRRAGPAARRASDLVVIGLVAQSAAEPVLRQGSPMNCSDASARARADRLDIGGVLVHRAAGAERVRQGVEIVAAPGGVGGVQCLLVGARAGRRAAEGALAWRSRRPRRDVSVRPPRVARRRRCPAQAPRRDARAD